MSIVAPEVCPFTQIATRDDPDENRPLDILLVEDDLAARRALELTLGHMGHLVISVGCAADADAMLETFRVDLVISDHRLPDGTSETVLKTIRARSPGVPAIALSGCADDGLAARMLAAGYDAWLSKPLNVAHLQRAACTALGRPL